MKGILDRMASYRWGRRSLFILTMSYIAVTVGLTLLAYTILIKDLKADLGNKAMVLAIDVTHWLDFDRAEFDRLMAMDFNAVLEDPYNRAFEKNCRDIMQSSEIKYIYLRSPLTEKEVRYSVGAGEESYYGAPVGYPLDNVYILDAVVDDKTRLDDTDGNGYTDKSRFTVMLPEMRAIMEERKPTYVLETAEWGTYLVGYAPYFSPEGEFLGMVGVDLYPMKYYSYLQKSMVVIGIFFLALLFTGLAVLRLLKRTWKAEERIRLETEMATIDGLTGLMNRRSFSDRLAHEYAISRREGMVLSVGIVDLENFSGYDSFQRDAVLIETANYLRNQIKRSADGLCRYGGDEFLLFFHNAEAEDIHSLAQLIVKHAPYPVAMGMLLMIPEEDIDMDYMNNRLNTALGDAKKSTRLKLAVIDEVEFL